MENKEVFTMNFPIIGSIHNAGKMAELNMKWQTKKNDMGKPATANKNINIAKEEDPQIKQFKEDLKDMREGKKIAYLDNKLKSGEELTTDELQYLKKNNPALYQEAMEIKQEKEQYRRELKACKSKEEVEKLKINKMNSFMAQAKSIRGNATISKAKKLELMERLLKKINGINKDHIDFVESLRYKQLPDKEDSKEIKNQDIKDPYMKKSEDTEDTDSDKELDVTQDTSGINIQSIDIPVESNFEIELKQNKKKIE